MKRYLMNVISGMVVLYNEEDARKPDMTEISETEANYRQGLGPKPGETLQSIPQGLVEKLGQLNPSQFDEVAEYADRLIDRQKQEQAASEAMESEQQAEAGEENEEKTPESTGAENEESESGGNPEGKPLSRMSKVEMAEYATRMFPDAGLSEDELLSKTKEDLYEFVKGLSQDES